MRSRFHVVRFVHASHLLSLYVSMTLSHTHDSAICRRSNGVHDGDAIDFASRSQLFSISMRRSTTALPGPVSNGLNRIAESAFGHGGSSHLKRSSQFHSKQARIEIDYASSLPLQMLLYFNVCFFPCWLFSLIFVLPVLTLAKDNYHVILMIFAFVFKAIIEFVRLYLGYAGNLAERLPESTAFCLLTTLFQIPLSIFLLIYPLLATIEIKLALIFAVEIIYLVFLALEMVFGIATVRVMVAAQSSRFHYRQFEEAVAANEGRAPSG